MQEKYIEKPLIIGNIENLSKKKRQALCDKKEQQAK